MHDIHSDYTGVGTADKRLNEHSFNKAGVCGGVGMILKKCLQISPVTTILSDIFCTVKFQAGNLCNVIFIIDVYLPSSDHLTEEFI